MDNAKKIELTAEGRQKLVDELAYREGEKHDEIVERIKEARGFGDLSENSEYDAAKEEQSKNESRINEIRQILSVATVVEDSGHALTVSITAPPWSSRTRRARSPRSASVGTTETNSLEHRISVESPVGKALVGHEKGDKIEVVAPSGKTRKVHHHGDLPLGYFLTQASVAPRVCRKQVRGAFSERTPHGRERHHHRRAEHAPRPPPGPD